MRTVTQSIVATTTAIALTACGGSGGATAIVVRMPPSEMAVISPSTIRADVPIPAVRTINGTTHQITGPIQKVEIDMKGKVVPVALPFKARVQDAQLEVLTDVVRTYPVQDISYVQIQYGGPTAASRRREGASGGLVFGGLIVAGLGTAILVAGSDSGGGGFINLGGIVPIFGGGLAILGAGLLIAGVSVGASSSTPAPAKTTKIQPKLHLSPTGGAVSFAF